MLLSPSIRKGLNVLKSATAQVKGTHKPRDIEIGRAFGIEARI